MALNQLNQITSTILRLVNKNALRNTTQINKCTFKTKNQTNIEGEDDDDKPIQYSTSPAAEWTARHSQAGVNDDNTPWYQPHIVIWSTISFLVYFGYLREPNDFDEAFEMELGDYFPEFTEEELEKKFGKKVSVIKNQTNN